MKNLFSKINTRLIISSIVLLSVSVSAYSVLTKGGIYSVTDGMHYAFSYHIDSREDHVRQLVYKSFSYSIPGIEYGGGYGPSWYKIDSILPEFSNDDVPILIDLIDKDISAYSGKDTDISFSICWILSKMQNDVTRPLLAAELQLHPDSHYIKYALEMISWRDNN